MHRLLEKVLIFLRKIEDHIEHVYEVLMLLEKAVVSLKIRKCQLFRKRLDYLGHVLLPGVIAIAKDSTSAIVDENFPQDMILIRHFLGP